MLQQAGGGRPLLVLQALLLAAGAACSAPLAPGSPDVSRSYLVSWTIAVNNDLDMVYVLDGSPTTAEWQPKVAAQLPQVMSTVQGCEPGGVARDVQTTMITSPDAKLLAALQGALPGALRRDAKLGIMFITGGDDTSPADVPSYVAAIRSLKPDPDNQIARQRMAASSC